MYLPRAVLTPHPEQLTSMEVHRSPALPPTFSREPQSRYQRDSVSSDRLGSQSPTPVREHLDHRREKKYSANHVKSRPAQPAVISSIISSLDSLTPPGIPAYHYYPDTPSKRSRTHSPNGSFGSKTSLPMSVTMPAISVPGPGVDYGIGSQYDDEDETLDAAPPPTIPTSRSPSGLSNYSAPHTLSFTGSVNGNGSSRPYSITSQGSLNSATGTGCGPEKHLSTDGKVIRNSAARSSQETLENRRTQRHLPRIISQETLRPLWTIERASANGAPESPVVRKAERVSGQTPPPKSSSKTGLYLGDSAIDGQSMASDSPGSNITYPEDVDSPKRSEKKRVESPLEPAQSPPQAKPPSTILDSIPLRTSSVIQPSVSPKPPKERERKQKRHNGAESVFKSSKSSKPIPETSWADLGEEDETVKRIRELRKKRETRLMESSVDETLRSPPTVNRDISDTPCLSVESADASVGTGAHIDGSPTNATPVAETNVWISQGVNLKPASRVRPAPNRASTEPFTKAYKILGIGQKTNETSVQPLRVPSSLNGGMIASPEAGRHQKRPRSSHYRPVTALSSTSPTPSLSLDYSYAQAVDALQGAERELNSSKPAQAASRPVQRRASNPPPVRDATSAQQMLPNDSQETASTPSARPRSSNRNSFNIKDRRTTDHHPGLPLDFDQRKSRRKSMSDAWHTRLIEEPRIDLLERRDSIEDAVLDYLTAERLSQVVQHPVTGRKISYSEVGDPNGAPVFICVGMGLTRFVSAFYDELATTLRLRLITLERPGVANSDPYPPSDKSGPLNWPDDVLAICQHLNIARFSILAHSAGAIYALATALILPHLVKGKVHLLAPWIPPSQLETFPHSAVSAVPAGALPRSQRILRVLPAPFLKAANSSFVTVASASLKPASKRKIHATKLLQQREAAESPGRGREGRPRTANAEKPDFHRRESMMLMDQLMPETKPMENFPLPVKEEEKSDAAVAELFLSATATPTDPNFEFASVALKAAEHAERERQMEYTSRLTQRTWELATRDSNPATDLLVCLERHRDVGFRYTDVNREVVITHGSGDRRVPIGNVKWLAEQINRRALAGLAGGNEGLPSAREITGDGFEPGMGGCEVRVLEGEGHGLMASAPIMGGVLSEIAGYWTGELRGRVGLK